MKETNLKDVDDAVAASILKQPNVISLKHQMIEDATEQYGLVAPVGKQKVLEDCFTLLGDYILFWFNTNGETTRVLRRKLPN